MIFALFKPLYLNICWWISRLQIKILWHLYSWKWTSQVYKSLFVTCIYTFIDFYRHFRVVFDVYKAGYQFKVHNNYNYYLLKMFLTPQSVRLRFAFAFFLFCRPHESDASKVRQNVSFSPFHTIPSCHILVWAKCLRPAEQS